MGSIVYIGNPAFLKHWHAMARAYSADGKEYFFLA